MTEVDAFLDDLDRLAGAAPSDDERSFYAQLLPASARAIGAEAAEWIPTAVHGEATLSWRDDDAPKGPSLVDRERLDRLRADGIPRIVAGERDGAPIVVCPVSGAEPIAAMLCYQLGPSVVSAERSLELAAAVSEVAARFELRRAATRVTEAESRLTRIEGLLVRLHAQSGGRAIAREASEEGRRLVGCDRLTVLRRSGSAWRIVATSGVAKVSRRSDAARRIERLTRVAMRADEAFSYPTASPEGPPTAVSDEAEAYRDAAGVTSLRVVPCEAPSTDAAEAPSKRTEFALLAEWFDGTASGDADPLLAALARHVGVASQRAGGSGAWLPRRGVVAVIVASLLGAGVVLSLVTPATLWVTVEGRFEPIDRARVFAPMEGVIEEVLVDQADVVTKGQPLLRMASTELRLKREEVDEAISATEAEIAALETAKLRASLPGRDAEEEDATALASRVAAQRERLGYQQRRRQLLEEHAARLVVRSPLGGRIVSWRPEDYLADRPVRRGQRLLEVVAGEAWRIELETPDHRSGHVLAASQESDSLRVEYVVRSNPSQVHTARVAQIAETTHVTEEGEPVVRVVATPDNAAVTNPRSGLGVSAKIDCGEHSLAYVWLHEAIEAIRRRWF